jgi:hypothetical protein
MFPELEENFMHSKLIVLVSLESANESLKKIYCRKPFTGSSVNSAVDKYRKSPLLQILAFLERVRKPKFRNGNL